MMVFDFLIGNADRHQSNWALLYMVTAEKPQSIRLRRCPLYDNGSSLCCYVNDTQLADYDGHDMKRFDALVNSKSKSMIRIDGKSKKRPSHLAVLQYLLHEYEETKDIIERILNSLTKQRIVDLLAEYPAEILGQEKNLLIRRYLCAKNMFKRLESPDKSRQR